MKLIDKYAGWFLCTLFSVLELFFKTFHKPVKLDALNVKNILFIKFWGMGSILLSTPLLKAVKEKYPDSKIHYLTLSRNREIVQMLEPVDNIITLNIDKGISGFIVSFFGIVYQMRSLKLDIVFDIEFFTRFSAIVTYLSGAKERIGFKAWEVWRGHLHTIGVPFNRYWHVTQNFYNLASVLGIPENKNLELLEPKPLFNEVVETPVLLGRHKLISKEYICINPNAGELALSRKWPKTNFIELTKLILTNTNYTVVYVGSKKERINSDAILSEINDPRVINMSGEMTISELIIIIKNAKMLVSNDSGPLHLAVALKTPTISFFGPETPVLYGHSKEPHTVFFKNIDCSPCINVHEDKTFYCHKNYPLCLEEIKVQEVWETLKKHLN
ncbi:MAG: hypothetical protein A2252_03140 [Elusimicrobia bacterium RIFOXYA2_FULL_39_19]|nr:MAG: hypothetical protein A2252_03140 [Elusimicrobia bacterium RIFOXYA2_FULL_39_19]